MNVVTPEEVEKIAALARLKLRDNEVSRAAKHMSDVLEHFSSIKDIDTRDTEHEQAATGVRNAARPDVAGSLPLASPEALLARVPRTKDGYVEVPGVFSDNGVS